MIPSKKSGAPTESQRPSDADVGEAATGKGSDASTPTNPKKGQMGEGSYEGTRDYQKSVKDYLKEANVQQDAKAARPSSAAEAAELDKAEKGSPRFQCNK